MKTMTASVASKEFGRYIDSAQREPVLITRGNRPIAVTFSIEDAEALLNARIETGVSRGLADVAVGRVTELTAESSEAMLAEFKTRQRK